MYEEENDIQRQKEISFSLIGLEIECLITYYYNKPVIILS